jgi:nitrogen fixation NifU-like protein
MTDLAELYQQVIVEHSRSPRNFRAVPGANRTADGENPLCGDQLTLELRLEGDRITDVGFQGSGCAISKAAASLMTGAVMGKTSAEAEDLFRRVQAMVTSRPDTPVDAAGVGKLAALAGVRAFPARVKCASLAWHTLHAALEGRARSVSTESPSD